MKKYNITMLSIYRSVIPALCALVLLVSCVRQPEKSNGYDAGAYKLSDAAELKATRDMGEEYIDGIIFIGESTTYHLKSRGVLKGGRDTAQVWSTSAGTMTLDGSITQTRIVYPETLEEISIGEAAARKRPSVFVLTFGLNGVISKIQKGEDYYKGCYSLLVEELKRSSPQSEIIIQACPPIAENMNTKAYGTDAITLNRYIDTLNMWARDLCAEQGIYYLAGNEALKNERGYLADEYQSGDGYHLSAEAYEKMLYYIRTHGIPEEEK